MVRRLARIKVGYGVQISADSQSASLRSFGRRLFQKPRAIVVVIIALAALWPFYRKFFINEWRERIVGGLPVVFVPDCPGNPSSHFKCGDRYTAVFRKQEDNQWCSRVRKNDEPEGPESCDLNIDAWDFARSWRYFPVEGVRIYYSWRGRVISPPGQLAGWLVTPETIAARKAHPLAIN